jgi:hypothetical protein
MRFIFQSILVDYYSFGYPLVRYGDVMARDPTTMFGVSLVPSSMFSETDINDCAGFVYVPMR